MYMNIEQVHIMHIAQPADNRAVRNKLNYVPSRFLYHSDFVTSRHLLYSPDVCNCTAPYIPRTVRRMPYRTLPRQE